MPSKHQPNRLEQHLTQDRHVFTRHSKTRDAHHHAVHHIGDPYQASIISAAVRWDARNHLAVDNQVVMPLRHTQDQDLCRRSPSSMNTECESSPDNAATARRSLHTNSDECGHIKNPSILDPSKNHEAYPGRACVCRTGFEVALDNPPLRACPY